ncbi:hypothetical protein EN45_092910 [Penicillium chrysogenum]|uniref:Uncharacterized protein n=1 Tax=Penicillium chrysogenum TaxID=5076 RepID=A0A167QSD5_PENCH|nr:hypothetical protein EN45_092910 [Penicillium chrysogenum]
MLYDSDTRLRGDLDTPEVWNR